MAWVPKVSTQKKNGVQAFIARSETKVKKEKSENYERLSRRFQRPQCTHYPHSPTMPFMPMTWNSSSGMTGYPLWTYFHPWTNITSYIMQGFYHIIIDLISCILLLIHMADIKLSP